jgi:hypothetical protein
MLAPEIEDFSRVWAGKIGRNPLALRVMEQLWREREANIGRLINASRLADPNYYQPHDPKFAEAIAHHLDHFNATFAFASGRALELGEDPLAFVRAHGVRRARQHFSLTTLLRAYRRGHKGFWEAMCELIRRLATGPDEAFETAILLSDYCIAYTDLISVVLTDAYLDEANHLAAQRMRLDIAVLDDLLRGRAPRSEAGLQICERAGLRDGRCMVALIAQGDSDQGPGGHLLFDSAARRRALELALPTPEFGTLLDVRSDELVAIVSSSVDTGARVASLLRAAQVPGSPLSGIRFGIGLDVMRIAQLPLSCAEAAHALHFFDPTRAVAHLAEVGIGDYLSLIADPTARRLVPPSIDALIDDSDLVGTLRTYAEANLNVKRCANCLGVHVNTIYNRLNRVRRVTGIDPRTYAGLSALIMALAITAQHRARNP